MVEEPFAGARVSSVGPLAEAEERGVIEGDGVDLDVIHWDTDRVRHWLKDAGLGEFLSEFSVQKVDGRLVSS